eukprot:6183789-Pleurochrysis_carterae.AAC.1
MPRSSVVQVQARASMNQSRQYAEKTSQKAAESPFHERSDQRTSMTRTHSWARAKHSDQHRQTAEFRMICLSLMQSNLVSSD